MGTAGGRRRVGFWSVAVALPGLTALVAGCPGDDANPFAKECRWLAGDAEECHDLASVQGCVGRSYDPGSLNCLGKECVSCDVTGVNCPRECAERGFAIGYREPNAQACFAHIQEDGRRDEPAGGTYLSNVQCCCQTN